MPCVGLGFRLKLRNKKLRGQLRIGGLGLRHRFLLIRRQERKLKGGQIFRRKLKLDGLKNWLLKERPSSKLTQKPKEQRKRSLFIVPRSKPRWLPRGSKKRRHLDALELRQKLLLKRLPIKLLWPDHECRLKSLPEKSHLDVPESKQRSKPQGSHEKTPSEDQGWRLRWQHKLVSAALVSKQNLKLTSGDATIASDPDSSYPNSISSLLAHIITIKTYNHYQHIP